MGKGDGRYPLCLSNGKKANAQRCLRIEPGAMQFAICWAIATGGRQRMFYCICTNSGVLSTDEKVLSEWTCFKVCLTLTNWDGKVEKRALTNGLLSRYVKIVKDFLFPKTIFRI